MIPENDRTVTSSTDFYRATRPLPDLRAHEDADVTPALMRLGPPPFPRAGFPFMGFLASVYDCIAEHAASMLNGADTSPEGPTDETAA